jgi:ribosomal protein L40E
MRSGKGGVIEAKTNRRSQHLMAWQTPAQVAYCGRCGAPLAPGATFCGRCGFPVAAPGGAAQPVYSYAPAPPIAYPTARRRNLSQIAIAGVLLAILALVTLVVSGIAASQFLGPARVTCTINCAPKIITPLPEGASFRSPTYKFQVNYSPNWTVRNQDATGITLGTKLGSVQVTGQKGGQPDQVLQATVAALPSAKWQSVTQVTGLKGAHIGVQDGVGAVYSANLVGSSQTVTPVRFAVIVANRNGVTVVVFAVGPSDPKTSPHGMPEGQEFDYLCTVFVWG